MRHIHKLNTTLAKYEVGDRDLHQEMADGSKEQRTCPHPLKSLEKVACGVMNIRNDEHKWGCAHKVPGDTKQHDDLCVLFKVECKAQYDHVHKLLRKPMKHEIPTPTSPKNATLTAAANPMPVLLALQNAGAFVKHLWGYQGVPSTPPSLPSSPSTSLQNNTTVHESVWLAMNTAFRYISSIG